MTRRSCSKHLSGIMSPNSRLQPVRWETCEFGDMIPERCFGDDKEIMLARGEINFLDLDPDFLGEFSRRLTALRSVPDRANSLVGPVDRQYECRHVVLHRSDRLIACRSRGRPTCSMLKLRERHKGRRCVQTASLPTA